MCIWRATISSQSNCDNSLCNDIKTVRLKFSFIFGSVARAEEDRESDIDLMVIGDASFSEVSEAIRSAEHSLSREINVAVYPVEELVNKIRAGHHFLKQVMSSEKLFLMGDQYELTALLAQPVDS